jgi:hypothetical protein
MVMAFLAGACSPESAEQGDAGPAGWRLPSHDLCQSGRYADPEPIGVLEDERLVEISGLASSLRHPGLLWGHNDSGDEAQLYAFDEEGRALGQLMLEGVEAVDFEDLESAPCPDGEAPCLWVADTGDNGAARGDAKILVVPEPDWPPSQAPFQASVTPLAISVEYPGGPVNVEALAIAPDLEALYLFEKTEAAQARVFRLSGPFTGGRHIVAEHVKTFDAPGIDVARGKMITGATFHLSGKRILLRVYTGVFEYDLGEGEFLDALSMVEPLFAVVGPLAEKQGEAVAYDSSGTGILTVSEDPAQTTPGAIHHARCF